MTESEAVQRGIPPQFLKPVLTSPRCLHSDVIEGDTDGAPVLAERLFLLDCQLPPEQVKQHYPKLWNYLEKGRSAGTANGYLCRSRDVWYFQERRAPAPFLVSYMGRSSVERDNPFRFFLNCSKAVATNCFLNLYPKPGVAASISNQNGRAKELLNLLKSVSRTTAVRTGRSYGGGLHKVEPRELLSLPLDEVPDWLRAEAKPAQMLLV